MKVIVFIAVILIVCTTAVYAQGDGCPCPDFPGEPTYCGADCPLNFGICAEGLYCCMGTTDHICQDDVGKPCNSTFPDATCQPTCSDSSVVVTGNCTTGLQCCASNNGGDQCNIPAAEKGGTGKPCKKDSTGEVIIATCQPEPHCENGTVSDCEKHCPRGLTCCSTITV